MLKRFLRRHALLVGFVSVLLPLGALLGMQYVWLVDLQEKSAIADTARLGNYLDAVAAQVEWAYTKKAERALNPPAAYFAEPSPDRLFYHFRKKAPEVASKLFVVNFVNKHWYDPHVYDPCAGSFEAVRDPALLGAIGMAAAPYKILAYKGAPLQSYGIAVEEKDRERRILVNPVTDDASQVLGVVGMVIDEAQFVDAVLPAVIEKSLPQFFDQGGVDNLLISVHDGTGTVRYGSSELCERTADVTGRIPFVFSDWTVALASRYTTPEEWARSNFYLNISFSAVLALALLGGLALALRSASREVAVSRMKSEFVSNVSHELRTPLASIRVFGELLRLGRAPDREKTREYGEYIETESRRLTQLIDNILDFSKIESGARTYETEPASLEAIAAGCVRSLEVGLRHRGYGLAYDGPDEPLPPLPLDADAIALALTNLIDNAVKYSTTPHEIVVRLRRRGGQARLSVVDRGIGISRDEQEKIFERFHRVGTGLVHDVKGSGLGLAIVRHVVEAHGGSVRVRSTPGEGSTFSIRLPLPDAAPGHEPAADELPLPAEGR